MGNPEEIVSAHDKSTAVATLEHVDLEEKGTMPIGASDEPDSAVSKSTPCRMPHTKAPSR